MTPVQLEILLHYRYHPVDFREGDFSAPAVREAIDWFLNAELLVAADGVRPDKLFDLGERGEVFVQALCAVPLPTKKWVME